MIDYQKIEEKWLKIWEESGIFKSDPDEREGIMVTAAFPYLNMPLHIGHLRTYSTADAYARYMRLKGFNVIYPMGFHKTGTPALAIAKRVVSGDAEIVEQLKAYGVPDDDIRTMRDPLSVTNYFHEITSRGFHKSGLSIDWRRTFTSIDAKYSKMIEWQFQKLKEKGYLVKGTHIIGWCTNEQNPVGQHDTKGDVQPEIESMNVILFKDTESDIYFPCATYRPETIYGVTNIFVKDDADYVIAEIFGLRCYLAKRCSELLRYQTDVRVIGEVSGRDLLGRYAINPITEDKLPVLPGFFVRDDFATGVVMSVPSHAPFDYVAIESLRSSGYNIGNIGYDRLIDVDRDGNGKGIGRSSKSDVNGVDESIPARAYLYIFGYYGENGTESEIESATKLEYREEEKWGRMAVGDYKGMEVSKARELISESMRGKGIEKSISIIGNEDQVYCRCGTVVIPKLVNDQWFIDYGNKELKERAIEYLPNMRIYPESARKSFSIAFGWIDLRAAERSQGLGTRFPLNPSHIIESLSDSTIYTTMYTYIHILESRGVSAEQLNYDFFDFVYNISDDVDTAAKSTGIDVVTLKRCKDELRYWYRFTSRHSGSDLITNHLTMYIFNHLGIFGKELWPKQIVANGLLNYEGKKMSKSMGNIVPLNDGIEKFGADPLRFIEIAGSDVESEADFRTADCENIKAKNEWLLNMIRSVNGLRSRHLNHMDYWLYSKLNSKISRATDAMDGFMLRQAYIDIYYNSISELRHYISRGGDNQAVVTEFLDKMIIMLSPVMCFFAEEMWSELGHTDLIERERWPVADRSMISESIERLEEMVESTISDINDIIGLTSRDGSGRRVREVRVIIAAEWKSKAYRILVERKSVSDAMKDISLSDIDKQKLSAFLLQFAKRINYIGREVDISADDVINSFRDSVDYISKAVGHSVVIEYEPESVSERASRALPFKPAIEVVWVGPEQN